MNVNVLAEISHQTISHKIHTISIDRWVANFFDVLKGLYVKKSENETKKV